PVYAKKNAYPFIFIRAASDEKLLVVINPSAADAAAEIPGSLKAKRTLLRGTDAAWTESEGTTTIRVPGRSYAIYSIE
ncbi:MAG TPA: hypothetical protein PKI32_09755, partial [Opitutales bacterium]|nr:hypothetical protein [Opitutales bacterium]